MKKASLCDDNSVEKLKKQPNFYAKRAEIRSAFFSHKLVILLVYKEAYFNTNDLDSAIPSMAVSLMQEFDGVFPEDIPNGLQPLRGIEHQIEIWSNNNPKTKKIIIKHNKNPKITILNILESDLSPLRSPK